MKKKNDGKDHKIFGSPSQGIALIVTAITGVIAAIGGIIVPIYLASPKPTVTPEIFSNPPLSIIFETYTATSMSADIITFTLLPTHTETATPANTATFTSRPFFI